MKRKNAAPFTGCGRDLYSDTFSKLTSIRIDGSGDNDTFIVDASGGNVVPTGGMTLNGNAQTGTPGDSLQIIGDGIDDTGVYTPDGGTFGNGTATINGRTITFTGLEPMTVSAMATYTLTTANSNDVLSLDSPAAGQNRISGTSGGVSIEAITFFDVTNFIVDMATNDGGSPNDSFSMDSTGLVANGLSTFTINGGPGNDTFSVRPSTTSTINVNGGPPVTGDAGVPPGDVLAVDLIGVANPSFPRNVPDGTVASTSHQPVNFTSIETFIPSDRFEVNNTQATATVLGSDPFVNLRDLSIHSSSDVDFFKIAAHKTGKLVVRALFDNAVGNLDVQIIDANGNNITPTGQGNSTGSNEEINIPVVGQEMYWVRVFGFNGAINNYTLEIENFAAPVPPFAFLDPASDSGRYNDDKITNNRQPRILVQADVFNFADINRNGTLGDAGDIPILTAAQANAANAPGAAVEVLVTNISTGASVSGFATAVSAANPILFAFQPGANLGEGVHLVSAAVRIFDGQRNAGNNPAPAQGRGELGGNFFLTIDITPPAVAISDIDPAGTDTGVPGHANTFTDRITSDTATGFFGTAEANALVRLFIDGSPISTNTINASDTPAGQTVAVPANGNQPGGPGIWKMKPNVDLNNSLFPYDGLRQIGVTAEDIAGNVTEPASDDFLYVFVDTQGPRVFDPDTAGPNQAIQVVTGGVPNPTFNLFSPTAAKKPTPVINGLLINVMDLPARDSLFLYNALQNGNGPASNPGNYQVTGDRTGNAPIQNVVVTNNPPVAGQAVTGTIWLQFAEPLPDDRFTLTVSDSLVDPAGNKLDGENNASQPVNPPGFPSGDGVPGGDFVARFTVDSRPELGAWDEGSAFIDINGDGVWNPTTDDATNRDIAFNFGLFTDDVFSGNFAPVSGLASGFDKLGAYGQVNGVFRFLLDFNHDGVPDANIPAGLPINGAPIAGNFINGHDGDEIGLFDGQIWYLDTSGDNNITSSPQDAKFDNGLRGHPIVGDFDGDGNDDLGTYQPDKNIFQFDLRFNGFGSLDATIAYGFPGVAERPIAADMNKDGVDDIGLWVPGTLDPSADVPADWYFLVSTGTPVTGTVNTLNHPFTPQPFGNDIYFRFGDSFQQPLVGNFDPPVSASTSYKGYELAVHYESGYIAHSYTQAEVVYLGVNSSVGLVNRYVSEGNYYWGGLINRGGTISAEIWRRLGGNWTKLSDSVANSVTGRIRFETTGDSLKLLLDGKLIGYATDSSISAGYSGTYVGGGSIVRSYIGAPVQYNLVTPAYADSFDGVDGELLGRNWFESSGAFVKNGNELVGQDAFNIATLYSYPESQLVVEADVKELAAGGSVSLLSRYRSVNELYWGGLVDRSGTVSAEIWRRYGGQWTKLSSKNIGTAVGRLRFETSGSSLRLYQDGNLLLTAIDGYIPQGTAGIWASRDTVLDAFWAGPVNYNPVTLTYTDAFNGTNGDFLNRNWFDAAGAFQYQGTQLAAAGNVNIAVLSGVAETNVSVETDLAQINSSRSAGLTARYLDENNLYWGGVINRFGVVSAEIWRRSGGVWTRLAGRGLVTALGRMRFSVTGTSLELSVGGVIVTASDGFITSAGSVGIYGSQGVLFDDFEAKKS